MRTTNRRLPVCAVSLEFVALAEMAAGRTVIGVAPGETVFLSQVPYDTLMR